MKSGRLAMLAEAVTREASWGQGEGLASSTAFTACLSLALNKSRTTNMTIESTTTIVSR